MPHPPSEQAIRTAWDTVVQAAVEGRRCPMNGHGVNSHTLRALTDRGDIRIKVYPQNWRVVEILTGEHAGKSTEPSPLGGSPMHIIEKGTPRRGRQQPSKPGLLK